MIFTITNYIMWFCLSSMLFMVLNLPTLFLLFFTQSWNDLKSFGLLAPLMLLTIGPSYTALLYSMGKLFREKDISTIKAFFKWVSASVSTGSHKVDQGQKEVSGLGDLPPPPPEVNVVL